MSDALWVCWVECCVLAIGWLAGGDSSLWLRGTHTLVHQRPRVQDMSIWLNVQSSTVRRLWRLSMLSCSDWVSCMHKVQHSVCL